MEQEYLGQIRIPTDEEYKRLTNYSDLSLVDRRREKVATLCRRQVPKARLARWFKFDAMLDMKDRVEWEILMNTVMNTGRGKGWIKDDKITPFDYEQDAIDRTNAERGR
ncbi:hypothetical protein ERX46_02560 [Brumimicrobium glaciale]|uniref:Uncharacterized protein n=1 Tax=Brumimicrobium glaciale TaxID=200475 RepID=A0A4Q4KRH8_9FLAO|nr:hypothetical protein [Brumimicrobium glaciale]RYM35893.1 hypothetical protein ERX46_02560 [Brumimicrobium glaciale]